MKQTGFSFQEEDEAVGRETEYEIQTHYIPYLWQQNKKISEPNDMLVG